MDLSASIREAAIFGMARRLPAEERGAYLDGACAGDALLRRQIEELLKADELPGTFLPEPDAETRAGGAVQAGAGVPPEPTLRVPPGASERPGDTIDRYRLMEMLGEGGFGVVYVAEQKQPVKRRVALKIIKLGMDTAAVVARFEAERQALAMMDHPNIAKVLDAGTTQTGRPYFVMELVRGIRITDYCDQANLSTRERLELFILACQAIQHAHQKGIIHRDIKPSNILVTLHDGVPVPKVIDFGIAKATEGRLTDHTIYTQLHQFIGTPAYMSPEQAEMSGLDTDTRSDIYSLGVLLYELLVGRTPFDAKELMSQGVDAMRKIIREAEPARPSTRLSTLGADELTTTARRRAVEKSKLLQQLRGDLDWIVMKCLEKDRSRRYETANGLAVDLRRHLGNEPVSARPPSTAYRFQKAFRRNKLVFTAAGVVLATLVLGLGVSTSLFLRESEAHEQAMAAKIAERHERDVAFAAKESETQERRRAEEGERSAKRSAYASDMLLAFGALDANNLGHARELMRRHLPSRGDLDVRGWEWRYLWQQCRGDEQLTLGPELNPWGWVATFLPDGQTAAAACLDGTVKLFDPGSRRVLASLPHPETVPSLAVSPDGRLLVSGCNDGIVRLWDMPSGQPRLLLTNSASSVSTVILSRDGKFLAWSCDDRAVLWEVATQRERASYSRRLTRYRGWKSGLALSPDNRLLAVGWEDGKIEVWDWQAGKRQASLDGHRERILALAFSPDGTKLVSACGSVKVWDVGTHRELASLTNHSSWVGSLSFSPDGKTLATAGADQTVRLWSTESWQENATLRGHEFEVWSVEYSPDGRRLITASRDGTLKIWGTRAGGEPKVAQLHVGWPHWFTSNGQFVLQVQSNRTFSVTDTATLQEVGRRPWPVTQEYGGAALSSDRSLIAVGLLDGSLTLLEASTGRELFTPPAKKGSAPARRLEFSRDGRLLAVIKGESDSVLGRDKEIELWEMSTRRLIQRLDARPDQISRVSFSPDNHALGLGYYYDSILELWDLATGGKRTVTDPASVWILGVGFSGDGRTVATAGLGPHISLWEVETGKRLAKMGGDMIGFASPVFSGDGQRLAAGAYDGSVMLWDMTGSKPQQVAKLTGSVQFPGYVSFPPDGNTVIALSDSQLLRVWRAPTLADIDAVDKARGPLEQGRISN